jgi:hypothetical protein
MKSTTIFAAMPDAIFFLLMVLQGESHVLGTELTTILIWSFFFGFHAPYYSFQFNWYFPTLGMYPATHGISLSSREILRYSPLYYSYCIALHKLGKNFAHNDY